jgi:hypothetical protein
LDGSASPPPVGINGVIGTGGVRVFLPLGIVGSVGVRDGVAVELAVDVEVGLSVAVVLDVAVLDGDNVRVAVLVKVDVAFFVGVHGTNVLDGICVIGAAPVIVGGTGGLGNGLVH